LREAAVQGIDDTHLIHFLIELAVLMAAGRLLADVMRRIGQAAVIGELLGGVLLGPSMLGRFAPEVERWLFPPGPPLSQLIDGVAWLGVILLLVQIGLESDFQILRGVGQRAGIVAGVGAVASLGSGYALGWWLPESYRGNPEHHIIFALFVAVSIAISAVPVIAKVLLDLNLMRRNLGMLILGAGLIDDFGGWLLLSIVAALAERGTVDLHSLAATIAAALAFVGLCAVVGFRLVAALLRWVNDNSLIEHSTLTVMIGVGLICAVITQAIGIHAVFGAFAAGLMLGQSARVRRIDVHEMTAVATGFLAPVFFAYSGFRTDIFAIASPAMLMLILAVACAAKLIGSTAGGLLAGLDFRESIAAGVGLNARGGMGVVAAVLGLNLGVLTPEMYSILIVVAIATSMMSSPLLGWLLGGLTLHPEEIARLERDKLSERMPFLKAGARLLVLAGGGLNAELGARLAAAVGNHPEATITLFHAATDRTDGARKGDFQAQFDRIAAMIEKNGGARVLRRTLTAESIGAAIAAECQRGYDAVFAGASRVGGRDSFGGNALAELIRAARVPIIIARAGEIASAPMPRRILAPITGTAYSRLALTIAIMCAQTANGDVTALYVSEQPPLLPPALGGHDPQLAADILDDARTLGDFLGATPHTRVLTGAGVEPTVLHFADSGDFDMIFLGVLARAVEGRPHFGPKVEQILASSRRAVAIAVMPEKLDLTAQ
jgi:Kef-type K+ transport system membrane component KefB/nucleotide-binding universal stress UspA family protein